MSRPRETPRRVAGASIGAAILFLLLAGTSDAAAGTWTGKIGDSMCGATHAMDANSKQTDADCVRSCVKGGEKYVFVTGDKTYEIANQDFAGLDHAAGATVQVTGEIDGEKIRVTRIVPAPKEK